MQNQNINSTSYFRSLHFISLQYLLLLLIAFLLFQSPSHARTTVSGEVYGTWTADEGPYMVEDDLIIPQDSTLTLEPGVEVIFELEENESRDPYVFYVFGNMIAEGTETDSIYFSSNDASFMGFSCPFDNLGHSTHFEYCVIDYAIFPFNLYHGNDSIRHSRIMWSYTSCEMWFSDQVTIEHCSFLNINANDDQAYFNPYIKIVYNTQPIIFNHVYAPGLSAFLDHIGSEISYCTLQQIETRSTPANTDICNNKLQKLKINSYSDPNSVFNIFNNSSPFNSNLNAFDIDISDAYVVVEDNYLRIAEFYNCTFTLSNNSIINESNDRTVDVTDCSGTIHHNTVYANDIAIRIYIDNIHNISILNNSIYTMNKGIDIWDDDRIVEIVNNVILGDGYESTGIYQTFSNDNPPEIIQYNCFGLLSQNTYNFEFPDGNIIANPQLSGGDPFDYHLQASSPCIDAGDPDFPDDPDGTPCDIGAIFYDQRLDNPPTITSPRFVTEHSGSYFSYTATAVDDYGPIEFTFENLPEGIEVSDLGGDWVAGDKQIAGTVPFDIPGFTFTVIATDVISQADTQYVYVDLEVFTLLQGEISGTLHVEESPYLVIEDLFIPENDTLLIEPGVTVLFRPEFENDRKLKIVSYGTLIAEGTQEDSIKFDCLNFQTYLENGYWKGIVLKNHNIDSLNRFIYTVFSKAYDSIVADSSCLEIYKSSFQDNHISITLASGSSATIDSTEFYADESIDVDAFLIVLDNTSINISNCSFIQSDRSNQTTGDQLIVYNNSEGFVENCYFYGGRILLNNELVFRNNFVENLLSRVRSGYCEKSQYYNNIFKNVDELIFRNIDTLIVVNNIIMDNDYGIELNESINYMELYNNIFKDNEISIGIYDDFEGDLSHVSYNCFSNNDSLSIMMDLDDTNLNLDPLFSDSLYHLYGNSPCIDTGHPDISFNDIDGTRNDIGLYGGPYGQSYEYEENYVNSDETETIYELVPYPNPFNNTVTIPFHSINRKPFNISIYNILGQKIQEFYIDKPIIGINEIMWTSDDLASGHYFVCFNRNNRMHILKIICIK